MAEILSDLIDFEGFEDVVETSKLRKASSYVDEIETQFRPVGGTSLARGMFSTKLRGNIDFRPGELTCWAGYNGHRKSMFSGQVALDLIAQKRRVLLASFEMSPASTLARMARQAWGVDAPPRRDLEHFGSWTDGKLWIFDHMGKIVPSRVLAMCRYFAMEKMGHHVVIDSMMMVCKSEESMDEQKQFITALVRMAQETNLHIHLVTHCRKPQAGEDKPPTKYDLRGSASISDQAHNVITVWANKTKKTKMDEGSMDPAIANEPDAMVTVEKQRNGRWEGRCKLWFHEPSMRFMDDRITPVVPYAALNE